MGHEERARELFLEGQNCCQAVLLAFQPELGLEADTLLRLAAPFGGGLGGMRETCGAVSAMLMVMGLLTATADFRDTPAKAALYQRMQQLVDQFDEENGSHNCAELLGLPKGQRLQPSSRTGQYYQERPCPRLVSSAARILDQVLEGEL